jgi:hypothetical protein
LYLVHNAEPVLRVTLRDIFHDEELVVVVVVIKPHERERDIAHRHG